MADNEGGQPKRTLGQKAKGLGKRAVASLPLTQRVYNPWRKEKLQSISDAKLEHDEEVKARARAKVEGKEVKEDKQEKQEPEAALGIDPKELKGDDLGVLNNALMHAIVHGQRRARVVDGAKTETQEAVMRRVVCQPAFIEAIRLGITKTPLESVDTEYYEDMMKKTRKNLAKQLDEANKNSDHIIKKLDDHELDVLYVTMLSNPGMWMTQMEIDEHNRSDPANKIVAPKYGTWGPEVPKPQEAILRFIENVAIRERPGAEGDFIGNALKFLATKPTFVKNMNDPTFTNLISSEWVNAELSRRANESIEKAVSDFSGRVERVLTTAKTELESETGMPGLGFTLVTIEMMNAKREKFADASRTYNLATGGQADATQAFEAAEQANAAAESALTIAKAVLEDARLAVRNADALMGKLGQDVSSGRATQAEVDSRLPVIEEEQKTAKAALQIAERKFADAKPALLSAVASARAELQVATVEKTTADNTVSATLMQVEAVQKEYRALFAERSMVATIVDDITEHFRTDLTNARDASGDINSIPTKLERRIVNPELARVLKDERIAALCAQMEEVESHFPSEANKAAAAKAGAEKREQMQRMATALEMTGDKDVAEALRSASREPEDKQETDKAFEYKKIEFEGTDASGAIKDKDGCKLGVLRRDIEGAALPSEIKSRLLTVHEMIASRRYPSPVIVAMANEVKDAYSYPMRKAAQVSLDKFASRGYENLTGISETQWIIAKMVWESQSTGSDSPVLAIEKPWKKTLQRIFYGVVSLDYGKRGVKWTYRTILRSPHKDVKDIASGFTKSGWKTKTQGRTPDGRPISTWVPKPLTGGLKLVLKTFFIYSGIIAALVSASPKWGNPFSWPGALSKPVANWVGVKGIRVDERNYLLPFTWGMGLTQEENVVRVLKDSYDISERLGDRGAKYYKDTYGLGTRLAGEADYSQADARLKWAASQPEVLRYLQERVLTKERSKPMHVVRWKELGTGTDFSNGDTCSTRPDQKKEEKKEGEAKPDAPAASAPSKMDAPIPESCGKIGVVNKKGVELWKGGKKKGDKSGLNTDAIKEVQTVVSLNSKEKIAAYTPVEDINDGWSVENRVCCAISIEYSEIADGRVINTVPGYMDQAVADMISDLYTKDAKGKLVPTARGQIYLEKGKVKAAYFDDAAVTYRMVEGGQLINLNQGLLMKKYDFSKMENVDFLIAKVESPSVQRLMKMMLRGEDPVFVKASETKAEGMSVKVVRNRDVFVGEIWMGKIKAAMPNIDPAMDAVPEETLKATLEQAIEEGKAKGVVEDVTVEYNRGLLAKELTRLSFSTQALDILQAQADILQLIKDFESKGTDYQLSIPTSSEFVFAIAQHKGNGGNVSDFSISADSIGSKVSWAIGKGYIIKVNGTEKKAVEELVKEETKPEAGAIDPAAVGFWGNESVKGFAGFVQGGVIDGLRSAKGLEGKTMEDALQKAYAGDKAKMDLDIKAEIYRVLASKDELDVKERAKWGVKVDGEGGKMVPTVTKMGTATAQMRRFVLKYIGSKMATIDKPKTQ